MDRSRNNFLWFLVWVSCWGVAIAFSSYSTSVTILPRSRPKSGVVRYVFKNRQGQEMTTKSPGPTFPSFFKTGTVGQPEDYQVQSTGIIDGLLKPGRKKEDAPAVKGAATAGEEMDTSMILYGASTLLIAASVSLFYSLGLTPDDALNGVQRLASNPQETLQDVISYVQAMGPAGPLYFGIVYLVAEVLAVPATPLTLSAGYLFGLPQGVAVVLTAATIAASISFFVGKTFLRSWVEGILEEKPDLAKIDKAIGREGFKLLLLVRLSPIFPFALSNYIYGASSIEFAPFFWGTLLGFSPGTTAYVYTGMVGQALTLGEGTQPWYVYAGGFAVLLGFMKLVTDVATEIVSAIDDEDGSNGSTVSG